MTRDDIISLIREHYDPEPRDWPRHRGWDDGADDIADQIMAMAGLQPPSDEQLAKWVQRLDWDAGLSTTDEIKQLRSLLEHIGFTNQTPSILVKRPVAFRIPRMDPETAGETLSKTEHRYFNDEKQAYDEAAQLGVDYQALYVRDGTAIVAEWEPIASAPTDGSFLVCGNENKPFVATGRMLWMALKEGTPSHLALNHLTHWMPLPAFNAIELFAREKLANEFKALASAGPFGPFPKLDHGDKSNG